LELIALGEVTARHYRHPVHVHYAVLAGATWEQIGAASGADADEARAAYRGWAQEQHEVRLEFPGGTIGLVGTYQMSFALVDYLQKGRFSNSRFVDATDLVDRIKVIKSAEEQALIRGAAAMQDAAMRTAFAAVEPGMRDRDVAAIAQCYSQRHGSEHGIYLCASMPADKPSLFGHRHFQNRVIQDGDTVALLVEDAGPGGLYTELGRTCVLGKASAELQDAFAFALQARHFNLGLLKPGAPCKEVFAAYNDFMARHGRPQAKPLPCQG